MADSRQQEPEARLKPDASITVPDEAALEQKYADPVYPDYVVPAKVSANPESPGWKELTSGQWKMIAVIATLTVMSVLYRILIQKDLDQTSLLFIGLPAILAMLLTAAPKAKSLTGFVMRGLTLALLFSGLILGEGFICILMAAPLFYLVALIVTASVQWFRQRKTRSLSCVALLLVPMSLEGTPGFTLPSEESVTVNVRVRATPAEVEQRLAEPLHVEQSLPFYLSLKFPHPVSATGSGLAVGDQRRVEFAGGHGMPGGLVVTVEDRAPGRVRFGTVSDMSKIAHWLGWETAELQWDAVDTGRTNVRCTIRYQRRLAPAWYFGPWERYAVGKTAEWLIAANAGAADGAPR